MDFSKGVLFDPGYSKYTLPFAHNIDAVYNVIFSLKSMHQRKFKFQTCYPHILKLLENSVSFYLGCLLWATFISRNFKDCPKNILDNSYYNQEVDAEAMLFEINYTISYLDKLKKDCSYYLGKKINIPEEWNVILSVYKDFLMSNDFLVKVQNTSDIKLPSEIKDTDEKQLQEILAVIEEVVTSGEMNNLFKVKSIIL